jgi:predicted dehydrogenase
MKRRGFLGAAAATALSASRVLGANERLRIGVIGCGGMANEHMRALLKMRESDNCEIAQVCDVYRKRLDKAAQLTGGKPAKDYRAILDDRDIDYVVIATPEHWHFQMILEALSAGKHVYTEKPMTQTVEQARKVVERVRALPKQKLQVGVQGMSDDSYETANRYISAGALGKVVLAQIDYSRNYIGDFWVGDPDPDVRPGENLDWKAWLGPAPKRDFDTDRFLHWRRYWDYSGGIASDLFIHRVTRIIKSLNLTFPDRGVGAGGKWHFSDSKAEIPDTFNILLDYPEKLSVQLVSSMANDTPVEHLIRGHHATLKFDRSGFTIVPQRAFEGDTKMIVHHKTGGEEVDLHHRNLMNAIRQGETLKCDASLGMYGVAACEMGVQSYRRQKYMKWDAARQRIVAS